VIHWICTREAWVREGEAVILLAAFSTETEWANTLPLITIADMAALIVPHTGSRLRSELGQEKQEEGNPTTRTGRRAVD